MKKLTLFLLLIPVVGHAQLTKHPDTGLFTLQAVVNANGTAKELHKKAQTWLVNAYVDAKSVIQVDDKEDGKIIVKGVFNIVHATQGRDVYHTLTIDLKDGRYRYTINHIIIDWITDGRKTNLEDFTSGVGVKKLFNKIDQEARSLILSLNNKMAENSNTDDW